MKIRSPGHIATAILLRLLAILLLTVTAPDFGVTWMAGQTFFRQSTKCASYSIIVHPGSKAHSRSLLQPPGSVCSV
jgi:hypothetical protein